MNKKILKMGDLQHTNVVLGDILYVRHDATQLHPNYAMLIGLKTGEELKLEYDNILTFTNAVTGVRTVLETLKEKSERILKMKDVQFTRVCRDYVDYVRQGDEVNGIYTIIMEFDTGFIIYLKYEQFNDYVDDFLRLTFNRS